MCFEYIWLSMVYLRIKKNLKICPGEALQHIFKNHINLEIHLGPTGISLVLKGFIKEELITLALKIALTLKLFFRFYLKAFLKLV